MDCLFLLLISSNSDLLIFLHRETSESLLVCAYYHVSHQVQRGGGQDSESLLQEGLSAPLFALKRPRSLSQLRISRTT